MFKGLIKRELLGFLKSHDLRNVLDELPTIPEIAERIPVVRTLPYILGAWDGLSEEERAHAADVLLRATIKLAEMYVGSK